jgi:hypothetical protein
LTATVSIALGRNVGGKVINVLSLLNDDRTTHSTGPSMTTTPSSR